MTGIASATRRNRHRKSTTHPQSPSAALSAGIALAHVLLAVEVVRAEESDGGQGEGDDTIIAEGEMVDDDSEWMVTAIASLTFFFILSAIGTVLAYVAIVDDLILKQFESSGDLIEADVVMAEFLRGGARASDGLLQSNEAEFLVTIEYNQRIAEDTYKIRVRKQLRAKESDFIYTNVDFAVTDVPSTVGNRAAAAAAQAGRSGVDPETLVRDNRLRPNDVQLLAKYKLSGARLMVLVMPEYPKSALLQCHVRRSTGFRHRLSMIFFVGSMFLLAALCLGIAANSLASHGGHGSFHLTATPSLLLAVVGAVIVEGVLCYFLFNKLIHDILTEEYLNDGELVPTVDDSSISSGSDIFLDDQRYRNLSATLSTMRSEFSSSVK